MHLMLEVGALVENAHGLLGRVARFKRSHRHSIIELDSGPVVFRKALVERGVVQVWLTCHPLGKLQVLLASGFARFIARLFRFECHLLNLLRRYLSALEESAK